MWPYLDLAHIHVGLENVQQSRKEDEHGDEMIMSSGRDAYLTAWTQARAKVVQGVLAAEAERSYQP